MKVTAIFLVCLLGFSSGFEDKTIAQWLTDNGYSTLVAALDATGLTGALSQPGAFTVFAPTEAAFAKLGTAAINDLLADPDTLRLILQFHVVNEYILVPMIGSTPAMKDTLNGAQITITSNNGGLRINNDSLVSPSINDIVVNNGVIQPIDTVLIPPNLPSFTIAQYILQDNQFSDLFLALYFAGLVTTLDSPGDYTVFAPTDDAFVYSDNILNPTLPNAEAIYQNILKYHVVPGTRMASQLSNGQTLYTLQGGALAVTIDSAGVRINNATVIQTDLRCTNGVVHAINGFLIPPS